MNRALVNYWIIAQEIRQKRESCTLKPHLQTLNQMARELDPAEVPATDIAAIVNAFSQV